MPCIATIRTLVSGCFIFAALVLHAQKPDSLVCERDFSDIIRQRYNVVLRREATGTFAVMEGDSVRYALFRQNKHKTFFSIINSQGATVLKDEIERKDPATGVEDRIKSISPGNYFFKIRSRSLLPGTFMVAIQKKNCIYIMRKPVPTPPPLPDSTIETIVTIKFDSSIYLASKLNLKNKQRLSIPVDSLQGDVMYEIRSSGGAVKYSFLNSRQKEVKRGKEEYSTGKLTAQERSYNLFIENEDKVVGKHVHINIRQIRYKRIPKPK